MRDIRRRRNEDQRNRKEHSAPRRSERERGGTTVQQSTQPELKHKLPTERTTVGANLEAVRGQQHQPAPAVVGSSSASFTLEEFRKPVSLQGQMRAWAQGLIDDLKTPLVREGNARRPVVADAAQMGAGYWHEVDDDRNDDRDELRKRYDSAVDKRFEELRLELTTVDAVVASWKRVKDDIEENDLHSFQGYSLAGVIHLSTDYIPSSGVRAGELAVSDGAHSRLLNEMEKTAAVWAPGREFSRSEQFVRSEQELSRIRIARRVLDEDPYGSPEAHRCLRSLLDVNLNSMVEVARMVHQADIDDDAQLLARAGALVLKQAPAACQKISEGRLVPAVAERLRDPDQLGFWARRIVEDRTAGTYPSYEDGRPAGPVIENLAQMRESYRRSVGTAVAILAAGRNSYEESALDRDSCAFNISRLVCADLLEQAAERGVGFVESVRGLARRVGLLGKIKERLAQFVDDPEMATRYLPRIDNEEAARSDASHRHQTPDR